MNRRDFLKSGAAVAGARTTRGLLKPARAPLAEQQPDTQPNQAKSAGRLLDFTSAVVAAPETLSNREQNAVRVLVEEIAKRTEIELPITYSWPQAHTATIVVSSQAHLSRLAKNVPQNFGSPPAAAEGYAFETREGDHGPTAAVVGTDERGVLFGVGGLLRRLRMSKGQILAPDQLRISTSPKYRLRGHQLGYRPKTNSYDGWTVPMWEQYIRDLAVFGTNAIELIPPRSDDEPDSPHFWLPPQKMMVEMSSIGDRYGLDVWTWYPAMDSDYSNPQVVERSLAEWAGVFRSLPRLDAVFVPGGDPGRTEPKVLVALLEKQAANLRAYHSTGQMWVSPQSFDEQWMNEFLDILARDGPRWLGGVVFGPQIRLDIAALRKRVPSRYPIRLYPDITHTLACQFPVGDWDIAFAHTEGREVVNPRPAAYANILRRYAPYSIGFISYSEGCNDDVNKIVWSALAWDPETPVIELLRDYSRYFISDRLAEGFAHGLLALERNWRAPLISNESVTTTLRQFQTIEDEATPHDLLKWRLQQGLYRAYYDAYVRSRLLAETELERQAMDRLEDVRRFGVEPVPESIGAPQGRSTSQLDVSAILRDAEAILDRASTAPVAPDWRSRILELGEALYQSIRMQLAVERYRAEAVGRAGSLDTLDAPITNLPWLKRRLREIRALAAEPDQAARVAAILGILNRTNPGPGGFYDNLGDAAFQPHLVRGAGAVTDPEFRASAFAGFDYPDRMMDEVPLAWKSWAQSLFDAPLRVHYPSLNSEARYKIKVVYAGDRHKIRLDAGNNIEIHGFVDKPWPIRPLEFDIPPEATAGGQLGLYWQREPGLGGNGRGCQVAEVWLVKTETRDK